MNAALTIRRIIVLLTNGCSRQFMVPCWESYVDLYWLRSLHQRHQTLPPGDSSKITGGSFKATGHQILILKGFVTPLGMAHRYTR